MKKINKKINFKSNKLFIILAVVALVSSLITSIYWYQKSKQETNLVLIETDVDSESLEPSINVITPGDGGGAPIKCHRRGKSYNPGESINPLVVGLDNKFICWCKYDKKRWVDTNDFTTSVAVITCRKNPRNGR